MTIILRLSYVNFQSFLNFASDANVRQFALGAEIIVRSRICGTVGISQLYRHLLPARSTLFGVGNWHFTNASVCLCDPFAAYLGSDRGLL